ncbi:Uncharacterised protein [Bordetella ansorpii]|uniref:Uncharacterized protein n=1 Tax=Bordetella ansorpii TaxID=288768 RepID=A0A157SW28_9BORD|nr:hypothetical protein [Bordetella ansorpii]SAI74541.1 Uncharacterised protein [Bordetella ansorpii]
MTTARIQQGELASWLGAISAADTAETRAAVARDIPRHVADALQILRCIEPVEGGYGLTDKGRLSLRMADPAAIHLR